MAEHDTDSNAPTFDISSLPSVHEHDWRNTSLDVKTAATFAIEGETVEDPYSDEYRPKEKEIARHHETKPATISEVEPEAPPPATQQMNEKPHVTFEGATTSPEEVVHINQMFQRQQQQPPSNNHTNSAQEPNLPNYVPNKYSAHHDPSMPDWEGVTIAERTMADISTLSPPPDDYYNPYVAPHHAQPPVAMVAAAAPGVSWEELEETDAERADWRNPQYKEGSTISGEASALQPRDRTLIWGLIGLVALLVVVVSIVVPVSIKAVANNNPSSAIGGDGSGGVTPMPSRMPVTSAPVSKKPVGRPSESEKPVGKPDQDNTNGSVGETTDDEATIEPETTDPATSKPDSNGRETDEPTPTPMTTVDPDTSEPTPSPMTTVDPDTSEPTPSPITPEITPQPTQNPTKSPITKSPTPFTQSSLLEQNLGERPKQWLAAHNTRRQYYHEDVYDESYIPLVWSNSLATDAQLWAEEQNDGTQCSAGTQDRNDVGQTGYAYWSSENGDFDSPEDILTWWFDAESNLDWDQNKKFTQVLWRSSKYLGCGESINEFIDESGQTKYCRMYVCNYIRKGNCNMDDYDDWTVPMLLDNTSCGDECPEEGCYWNVYNIERSWS